MEFLTSTPVVQWGSHRLWMPLQKIQFGQLTFTSLARSRFFGSIDPNLGLPHQIQSLKLDKIPVLKEGENLP
jgi:hypothetical protein